MNDANIQQDELCDGQETFFCGANADEGARGCLVMSSRTTMLCFMSHEANNVVMCLGDLCGAIDTLG